MPQPNHISMEEVTINEYVKGLTVAITEEHKLINKLLDDALSPIKIEVLRQANERVTGLVNALANYELKIQEREGWDG